MAEPTDRAARPLEHRPVAQHDWRDIVFAHWRRDPQELRGMLPPGTRPDIVDGNAWVGLVAYEFRASSVPPLPSPGRLGRMVELVIEVLTVDDAGRPGTTYRTVDTENVPAIVAAHALLGVPYAFAHARTHRRDDTVTHRSVRNPVRPSPAWSASLRVRDTARPGGTPRPRHAADVRVTAGPVTDASLARDLTTRAGIHARWLGQTFFWQREHAPLQVRTATLDRLDGDLPSAVGLDGLFDTAPDSLLVVDGTTVRYGWGGAL